MIRIESSAGKSLGIIVNSSETRERGINFFTENNLPLQVASMSHSAGHEIQRHVHLSRATQISQTMEVLYIVDGELIVDFYDEQLSFVCQEMARTGDLVILISGGHGFHISKDCTFIEVKQGPYDSDSDKRRF